MDASLTNAVANEWSSFAGMSQQALKLNPPRPTKVVKETRPARRRPEKQKKPSASPAPEAAKEETARSATDLEQHRNNACRAWVDTGADIVLTELVQGTPIDQAIDSVFDDIKWLEYLARYEEAFKKAPTKKPLHTTRDYFPWVYTHYLASPPTRLLADRVAKLIAASALADQNLAANKWSVPISKQPDVRNDHLWFMSDYAIPPALQNAMLHHRRSVVAVVSTYPITSPIPTVAAFPYVMKLMTYARECLELYLGVIANVPEAEITIVPPDGSNVAKVANDIFEPFRKALITGGGLGAAPD